MVELENKRLVKVGHGYAILIPKALVDCKVLRMDDELDVKIEKSRKPAGFWQEAIADIDKNLGITRKSHNTES